MKQFLSSDGLSNQTLKAEFVSLLDKSIHETHVLFITTAANVMDGDKSWLIENLNQIKATGVKTLDIIDIANISEEFWQPRIGAADVLFFSGGSGVHLAHHLTASGLAEQLPELLKHKIYAGISAGSMVTSSNPVICQYDEELYDEGDARLDTNVQTLGLNDIMILPHYNSPEFPKVNRETLKELDKGDAEAIYGVDDQSALIIENNEIRIIGEGLVEKF